MMDDYGTKVDCCCDEVAALKAEIARLEDIIAQMSDELVDAWEACEEAVSKVVEWQTSYQSLNAIRHKIVEEREYWREMYQNTSEALRKTGDRLLEAIDGGAP